MENKLKNIIKKISFLNKNAKALDEYEQTVKMFEDLVAAGMAKKNQKVLSNENKLIEYKYC